LPRQHGIESAHQLPIDAWGSAMRPADSEWLLRTTQSASCRTSWLNNGSAAYYKPPHVWLRCVQHGQAQLT
jgi:hypothetical protein